MSWHEIEGHDAIVDRFRRGLQNGRLASAFLFVGPGGIGKRTFALKLAQSLLCEVRPATELDPCERCASCRQVLAGTHPDLEQVAKPKGRTNLPIELLIGDKEHRMREGLCARIAMKPARGGHKVAIIDDADTLGLEGANCLLKTLEEPPPRSLLILIGTSPQRQLPTIRSRCQIVTFEPLSHDTVKRLSLELGLAGDEMQAERISQLAEGSLERAAQMSDADVWEFRREFYETLANPPWDSLSVGKMVSAFVEAAGSEASLSAQRQRCAIELAASFFRQAARTQVGAPLPLVPHLCEAVNNLANRWEHGPAAAAAAVERCLLAGDCVDANANQATNIECWIDDLARICRSGRCDLPEITAIL